MTTADASRILAKSEYRCLTPSEQAAVLSMKYKFKDKQFKNQSGPVRVPCKRTSTSYSNITEWRKEILHQAAGAMREATLKSTVIRSFREAGTIPIDPDKVLNAKNFPEQLLEEETPPNPKKRTRKAFRISNRMLTSKRAIEEMRVFEEERVHNKDNPPRKRARKQQTTNNSN